MKSAVLTVAAILGLALCCACSHEPASSLATTHMRIGDRDFTLEIAQTSHEKEVGLMHRDSLADDHGMIFPFSDEKQREFWNHDVHFPLDLLFLDAGGTVVSIRQMEKYSDATTFSGVPAEYVIELNFGTASRLHINVGARLAIPKQVIDARSE